MIKIVRRGAANHMPLLFIRLLQRRYYLTQQSVFFREDFQILPPGRFCCFHRSSKEVAARKRKGPALFACQPPPHHVLPIRRV